MRTETITRTVYKYDELTEKAKENAREWYRGADDYSWAEENRNSLDAFCDAFPVEARNWEYDAWSYHMSARFTGEDEQGEIRGLRLRTYLLNNYSHILYARKVYGKGQWRKMPDGSISGRRERKSRIMEVENDCPFTGYCFDESLLDNIRAFIKKPDRRTFADLLDDCLQEWAKACRDDCAYQVSDAAVEESIRCNEYEFTENGELA